MCRTIVLKDRKKIETFLKIANIEIPRYLHRFDRYFEFDKSNNSQFYQHFTSKFLMISPSKLLLQQKSCAKHFHA